MKGLDRNGQGRKAWSSTLYIHAWPALSIRFFFFSLSLSFSLFSLLLFPGTRRSLGAVCFRFRPSSSACVFFRPCSHRDLSLSVSLHLFSVLTVPLFSALGTSSTNNRSRLADELIGGVCRETDGSVASLPYYLSSLTRYSLTPCCRNNKTSTVVDVRYTAHKCKALAHTQKSRSWRVSLLRFFSFFLYIMDFFLMSGCAHISLARGFVLRCCD